jgi:hypothetical protein
MKQINQILPQNLQVEKAQEQSTLTKSLKKVFSLPEEDNEIIALKYASKHIGTMTKQELNSSALGLLVKIQVITGWVIPEDDEMEDILNDQFQKKLVEDYGNLNVDEIEYAFRKKGTAKKDCGKQMNLTLIDQVLDLYVENRLRVSEKEERKSNPPAQKIYSDEEILNERRSHIEVAFQGIRNGKHPLMHVYFKEVLEADGFLREGETVGDFFVRKVNNPAVRNLYVTS